MHEGPARRTEQQVHTNRASAVSASRPQRGARRPHSARAEGQLPDPARKRPIGARALLSLCCRLFYDVGAHFTEHISMVQARSCIFRWSTI
ncbi:unnamed protein product [Pieris macdunnoughi]|uniref:Uncharacterized protein n=1 Tax=Pieris macdunnoughi TaxID=345717 RepID=A0A821QYT0_9NEOP|nr:unnamed protein product [Pieris macdunnoughi]